MTHRAVDAALGLPLGSCSFSYGKRLSLLAAATDRLCELDQNDLREAREPSGRFDVLRLMRAWTSARARTRLLARFEVYLLALREPVIHERVLGNREIFLDIAESHLAEKMVPDARRAARQLLSLIDGELLRVAMFESPDEPYEPSLPFSRELNRYR